MGGHIYRTVGGNRDWRITKRLLMRGARLPRSARARGAWPRAEPRRLPLNRRNDDQARASITSGQIHAIAAIGYRTGGEPHSSAAAR